MKNADIRELLKRKRIFHYEVAVAVAAKRASGGKEEINSRGCRKNFEGGLINVA